MKVQNLHFHRPFLFFMASLGIAILETAVELDGLNEGLGQAKGQAEGGVGQISGLVNGALGSLAVMGAAAAAAVAAAVVGIGVAAFGIATDVQAAANSMQAQFGLTAEEAERMGDIAADVWGNNFTGSIEDATQALAATREQLGALSDGELQQATENAVRLSDVFGTDYGESLNAVKALTENLGLTTTQAFDLITTGMQSGANSSGDFLESISEYGGVFADAGFSAEQMYSILTTGAEAGVLGTDKIADAVKEMTVRLNEGGDGVSAAFDTIGLSFEEISGFVASGDEAWSDYFDQIVGGINDIEDPILRSQAQVAIFGTMAEDLGVSFTEGLGAATTSLEEMAGATEGLDVQYANLGEMMEGFKRQALLALEPIGDVLLQLANEAMPLIESAFAWFGDTLVPMIADAAEAIGDFISSFVDGLESGLDPVESFKDALSEFIPPEAMEVIEFFVDLIDSALTNSIENAQLAVEALRQVFEGDFAGAFETVAEIVESKIELIVETIGNLAELVGPALEGTWDAFVTWFNAQDWPQIGHDIVEFIIEGLQEFAALVGPMLAEWGEAFWNWVESIDWGEIGYTLVKLFLEGWKLLLVDLPPILASWAEAFWNWVTAQDWLAIGTAIVDGVIAGLTTAGTALFGALAELAAGALAAAKEVFGIHSPSAVFAEIGAALMAGLTMGIMENAGQPADALSGVAGSMSAEGAMAFADALTAVTASIQPAIEALIAIFSFDSGAMISGFDTVREFANLVGALTNVFAGVASDLLENSAGYALQRAEEMAAAATAVVEMVLDAVEALDLLAGYVVPDIGGTMHEFAARIDQIVTLIVIAANDISADGLAHAQLFADAAGAILDIIEDGIAGIEQLAAITSIENIHSQLSAFANSIHAIVAYIADVASDLSADGLEHAALFADAAGSILDIIEDGIAGIEQLAAITSIENIHNQLSAFANSIQAIVAYIADVAAAISGEALSHAEDFANAAGDIFDLIVPGIEAIQQLADYVAVGAAQISASGFAADLQAAIQELVIAFDMVAQTLGAEALTAAAAISDEAEQLLSVVETAVSALVAVASYEAAEIGQIASSGFAVDLANAVQQLITAFSLIGLLIGNEALTAAAAMAAEADQLLSIVETAVSAIAAVASYEAAEIGQIASSGFAVDLANAVQQMITAFSLIGLLIGNEALTAAAAMAASVEALSSAIETTLASMAAIGAASMPDTSAAMAYLVSQADIITTALTSSSATLNGSVVSAAQDFASHMAQVAEAVDAALAEMAGLVGPGPGGSLQGILDEMLAAMSNAIGPAEAAGVAIGSGFREGLIGALQQALSEVQGLISEIVAALQAGSVPAGAAGQSLGQAIADGIAFGIQNGLWGIVSAIQNAAETAVQAAQDSLQIASPSKPFLEIGEWIPRSMAIGVERQAHLPDLAVSRLASSFFENAQLPQQAALANAGGGMQEFTLHINGRVEDETIVVRRSANGVLSAARARGTR